MSNKTDEAVLKLLTKVREKKEAIKAGQKKPHWETSCTLKLDGETSNVNIQTVRDVDRLVDIAAFLLNRRDKRTAATEVLGVKVDTSFAGYPVSKWLEDLQTRVKMLKVEDQKKELAELDARVNKLVTPEQRREMELVELQKLLDD